MVSAMRLSLVFLLLLLGFLNLNSAQGSFEDCCLQYVKEVSPAIMSKVVSYRKQELDGGCNIRAIVFKLKRGRLFCANPREQWVLNLMKLVDTKPSRQSPRKRGKHTKRRH